jgi:hypothetical protein
MAGADSDGGETHAIRLSFRATQRGYEKLVTVAKARGWINAQGKPNVSKVLNYIIEQFDASTDARAAKKGKKRRGKS